MSEYRTLNEIFGGNSMRSQRTMLYAGIQAALHYRESVSVPSITIPKGNEFVVREGVEILYHGSGNCVIPCDGADLVRCSGGVYAVNKAQDMREKGVIWTDNKPKAMFPRYVPDPPKKGEKKPKPVKVLERISISLPKTPVIKG